MTAITDTPSNCTKCGRVTLHRPSADGAMHCLTCLAAPSLKPEAATPRTQHVVIEQRTSLVGGALRLTSLFVMLIILGFMGTCVYVCGSAANESSKQSKAEKLEDEAIPTKIEPVNTETAKPERPTKAKSK